MNTTVRSLNMKKPLMAAAVAAVIDPSDALIEKIVVGPELQAAIAALGPAAS